MNFSLLEAIAQKYGTPFYLMDEKVYIQNIQAFQLSFWKKYSKLIVGYSFKTNYVPALCKIAKDLGSSISYLTVQLRKKMIC